MPELPEVETMRRSLIPAIGQQILSVVQPVSKYRPIVIEPHFDEFHKRLVNRTIVSVERLGKRVQVRIDDDSNLLFQPKMAGLVMMNSPPNESHVRLVIELSKGSTSGDSDRNNLENDAPSVFDKIIYWDQRGLGTIRLWDGGRMEEYLRSGVIGPDALAVELEEFKGRFCSSARPIKPTLLDQARLAGIGNLYASEILHRSRIHPERPCNRISTAGWARIFDSTRVILLDAIEQEGSTLSDGTYRKSKEDPGGYQNSHKVYDRKDQVCLSCGRGRIVRIVQTQRSTFFCPHCQRK